MRDHEEVLRQLLSDLREKERASAVLGDHDGLLKYGSEADAIDATLAEPTTLRKRLADEQKESDARVALAGRQALDIFRCGKVLGSYTPWLHEALVELADESTSLRERLAEAEREREMVCYWLHPLDGEGPIRAAKRYREGWQASEQRVERLEAALRRIIEEEQSIILNGLPIGYISQSLHFATAALAESAPAPSHEETNP